ncbi:MAG: hypothetical protein C0425_04105 [Chlorobiaceae bacterium]|nr:hypothetical protein [Chlorobiaceae bacterium]
MNIQTINSTSVMSKCMRFIGAMLIVALMMPAIAFSQPFANPEPVPLLTAGTYGALAYSGITGNATVHGDVGTSTASIDVSITVTGGINRGVGTAHVIQAQTDLGAALTNANGRVNNQTISGNALGGLTLGRGVYEGGALDLASGTTLTLNGSATDVFIIRAASSLNINTNSNVTLTGGAVWSNVFWYVGSSATIFSGVTFNGIILAVTSITLNADATQVTAKFLANGGAVTINSSVLPVELTSFTASLNNSAVVLNWSTATEVDNFGFDVESRFVKEDENGRNGERGRLSEWNKIGFVHGHGNSNSPKEYAFKDKNPEVGILQYRLKQIDTDGAFEYSKTVEVNFNVPLFFVLYQNYPNPFNPSTNIQYTIGNAGLVTLKVYNLIGNEVATLVNARQAAGSYSVQFYASEENLNFSSGVYLYRLESGSFVSTKKFILIK